MIPHSVWNAQLPAGQHRVLLALWDFAHAWREGDGEWFVWPRVATVAEKLGLGQRAVHARLAELEARGWLRRDVSGTRLGWRLVPSLSAPGLAVVPQDQALPEQLGFGFDDPAPGAANETRVFPVDKPSPQAPTTRTPVQRQCTIVQSPPLLEQKSEQKRLTPRSFEDFERERSRGTCVPARTSGAADPVVDGRRVDRWEQEAWENGGADGVRRQRAGVLPAEAIGALAQSWLRKVLHER